MLWVLKNVNGTQKQVQISLHWKKLKGQSPPRMWALRERHGKLRKTSIRFEIEAILYSETQN